MLQFWQSLCLMLAVLVIILIYEHGIRAKQVGGEALPQSSGDETIEEMLMKEVL